MSGISIDGVDYDLVHIVSLKRSFSVLDGPNTGRVQTGEMRRDIIGTYYNYTLKIEPDQSNASIAQYDALYEIISSPAESHTIKVPYGQVWKQFKAYVTSGADNLMLKTDDHSKWDGLEINFIAMFPERVPS
nr:MAG TPA: hypothetical protein [Caudoviricetes sp.]